MYSINTLALKSILFSLIYGFSFLTLTYSQDETSIIEDDFSEGMGIWEQGKDATIVSQGSNEDELWLLLQKGSGYNNSDFATPNPHLTSELIDFADYCGVHMTFEMTTLAANSDVKVFLEVSHNNGESFQVLREISETASLQGGESFQNGVQKTFRFPIRSFLTKQMVFRLNTAGMTSQTQIYIDNIKFEGKDNEDSLLAIWQMGSLNNGAEDKLMPSDQNGNCVGVEAQPISFSEDVVETHFDVEGFNNEFLPEENLSLQSSAFNNGALCYELNRNQAGEFSGVSFSLTLTPDVKGQLSGFEFMERASSTFNGQLNNYPTTFELKVYRLSLIHI